MENFKTPVDENNHRPVKAAILGCHVWRSYRQVWNKMDV